MFFSFKKVTNLLNTYYVIGTTINALYVLIHLIYKQSFEEDVTSVFAWGRRLLETAK